MHLAFFCTISLRSPPFGLLFAISHGMNPHTHILNELFAITFIIISRIVVPKLAQEVGR